MIKASLCKESHLNYLHMSKGLVAKSQCNVHICSYDILTRTNGRSLKGDHMNCFAWMFHESEGPMKYLNSKTMKVIYSEPTTTVYKFVLVFMSIF